MSAQTVGLLIGGLVPALAYTVSNTLAKSSTQAGIGVGPYLLFIGLGILIVGVVFTYAMPYGSVSLRSGSYSLIVGLFWGIGTGAVALALSQYHAPISKLVPLFNMNTLFSVLLALWIFAEWKQVRVPQLLLGSVLIVLGGTLVARA
jgi:transporter family protein